MATLLVAKWRRSAQMGVVKTGSYSRRIRSMKSMRMYTVVACLVAAALFLAAGSAAAQDVAITNVRVIVGTGPVIESGTIIVRGGKIASVSAGPANTQRLRVIDAKGMSAMPGYIDGHKHVSSNPNE